MKAILFSLLILFPFAYSAQCITKKNMTYIVGDSAVQVYPENSGLFDKSDSLVGLLTWTLDPCTHYKVYTDKSKRTLIAEYYFEEDTIIAKHFYPNGKLRLLDKEAGKKRDWIYTAWYYDNGQLLYFDKPNDREPRTIYQYHPNGKIKRQFVLWGLGCWGTVKSYYASGKIQSTEEFTELTEEAQKNNLVSKKIGIWQYWNEDGKLIKKITFENDRMIAHEDF